jgi:hypothetical protein
MDISHITSQSLRRLLELTDKKNALIKGIEDIETEIANTLKGAASTVVKTVTPSKAKAAKAPKTRATRRSKGKASRPGGLKERILALLDSAGAQGLKVKEIAEKLGMPTGNISVWFSTTGKKITTKVEPGRYAAKGGAASSASAEAAPAAKAKGRKAAKPARKAKAGAKKKKAKGSDIPF